MKKILITIILIFLMILSCSENAIEIDCQIQGGGIIDLVIADTIPKDKEIETTIIYGKPNPCYVLQEVFTKTTDSSLSFNAKICYQAAEGTACPQVPVLDTTSTEFIIPEPGEYKIFLNDTSFVKKIVVL